MIFTAGLRFSRIIVSVFSSWTRPRNDRYSHWTGTITPLEATSALIVKQPERRGRVDEDVVVLVLDGEQRLVERPLAADRRAHRQLGAGQVDRRDGDVDLRLVDDVLDRQPVHEHVEHRPRDRVGVVALAHRQVALRIEVHGEHAQPLLLERDGEIEGRCRLGDTAFLVRERDDRGRGRVPFFGLG